MIPNNTRTATIDNHMEATERIRVQFDPNALDHLQILFTDLYGDQQTAVIREYSTNAWDAHIDAGKTDTPIEVTTPTFLHPFLKIVDHGVGMDADDIRNTYAFYGTSTKRKQKTTNGSMGIGAKSALTLTAQFTVTGVKNGVKTQVSVTREVDNSIFMDIVDESATDEPNGVTITVPVTASAIKDKAEKFFRYWEKGRVLLNGSDPSKLHELKKISKRVYLDTETDYRGHDVIFMGNVPYPLNMNFNTLRPSQGRFVAVSTMNGDDQVVFTPTREGLIYNDITNEVIAGFEKEINDHLLSLLIEELNACSSKSEAFNRFHEMVNRYSHSNVNQLTYKGETVPAKHTALTWTDPDGAERRYGLIWSPSRHRRNVDSRAYTSLGGVAFVVVNYTKQDGVLADHKRKVRQFVQEKGMHLTGAVLFLKNDGSNVTHREWIEHKFIDWNEIRKIRLNPVSSGGEYYGRESRNGGYTVVDISTFQESISHTLSPYDNIIYYSPADKHSPGLLAALTRQIKGAILVSEPTNRHAKLKRLFPQAMTVWEASQAAKKNLIPKVTEREWISIIKSNRGMAPKLFDFMGAYVDQIKDPELAEYVKSGESIVLSQDATDADWLGARPAKNPAVPTYDVQNNYKLLHYIVRETYSGYRAPKDEIIEYVNAHYERKNNAEV